jgi:prefoldin subunit 5
VTTSEDLEETRWQLQQQIDRLRAALEALERAMRLHQQQHGA